MCYIMDKDEVITLSSDEESDFPVTVDETSFKATKQEHFKKSSSKVDKCLDNFKKIKINQGAGFGQQNKPGELIKADIVDRIKNLFANNPFQNSESTEKSQNHSKPNIIDIDEPLSNKEKISTQARTNKINIDLDDSNNETGTKNVNSKVTAVIPKSETKGKDELENNVSRINETSNQNLKFFTEFVELCGSLEEIETDRTKLTKKLMKRYGEADCHYIKSEEFKSLIQKFRDKVTKNNLYIIAKEVTDELMYRKKIENDTGKTEKPCQRTEQAVEDFKRVNKIKGKGHKKQTKVINKIIKKLDKLGLKIQELEEKEVDLSDEEESAYVQLQRYRERFYQIYTKLSKFTNELSDIDRIYNRKICFSESKYPEINKCIEIWLNKTKRFPDFSDIMKLLESQSTALGLPSNREAIRAIAIEIFQKVGSTLQRKRKYELWDSLCGYLNDEEDPACKDPLLDDILKRNFEIRVKKEQEIFQHYAELQEKQRLEPEEVPDEEANRSPIESGNEDEEEIQNIEELMNKRLDEAVREDTEENTVGKTGKDDVEQVETEQTPKGENAQSKESKNNYKNCKSLKWRTENFGKTKSEGVNSEDSNAEQENEKEKDAEDSEHELVKQVVDDEAKSEKSGEDDSDLELIAVKNVTSDMMGGIYSKLREETKSLFESPLKRTLKMEGVVPEKRVRKNSEDDDFEIFEIDDENDNPKMKKNDVIDVHCCQIFTDNVFDELDERKKDWGKRKVFRDLTNLNRLMELHGKKRKISGLFSSSFFHRSFCEFDKSSWKKKFKVSFRSLGSWDQKCALNQEEKSGKTVNSDSGGDSDEKDIRNNSDGRGDDEGNNFFRGHGNGSEGDNNEDENKKSGRTDVELNDAQREEDDDEEEEEENNVESTEHSLPNQKTEEQLENKTPSGRADKPDQEEGIQQADMPSETPKDEGKEEREKGNVETENREEGSVEIENREEGNVETENKEEGLEVVSENHSVESEKCKDNVTRNEADKITKNEAVIAKELKREEEDLQAENKSTEVTMEEKLNEDVHIIAECDPPNQHSQENTTIPMPPKETYKCENIRANSSAKVLESHKIRTSAISKECESIKTETTKQMCTTNKPVTTWKSTPVDSSSQKPRKRTSTSTSDEEIVKRFLLHSPSSISITPPRKLSLSKSPSQAALQALATLRNLKGISATIVRGKPKDETIGGSYSRRSDQNNQNLPKRGRSDFPVISNVQTVTPKIVNVSGNVSGFDNSWPGISNATCDSSPIRISNVWGSLPNNFMQSMVNETITPGCSSQKSNPGPSNTVKKKNTKKTVEYVVLD